MSDFIFVVVLFLLITSYSYDSSPTNKYSSYTPSGFTIGWKQKIFFFKPLPTQSHGRSRAILLLSLAGL